MLGDTALAYFECTCKSAIIFMDRILSLCMNYKIYWTIFFSILLCATILRLLPLRDNNFYFTMDQGNDAVHVREIIYHQRPQLLGPETSIFGIYAGPLWYYFISIGYLLTGGHPVGSVLMLILLNVTLTAIFILKVTHETSPRKGLLVGALLQTSWRFYDSSRYGFNPFPIVFFSFILIFLLCDFLKNKNPSSIIWSALPIGLAFHADLASALPLTVLYVLVITLATTRKQLNLKSLTTCFVIVLLFLIPHTISEFGNHFSQTKTLIRELHNPNGIFVNSKVHQLTHRVFLDIAASTLRQIPELGALVTSIVLVFFFKKARHDKKVNPFVKYFVSLSLTLVAISWIFFVTNEGWRDWHTIHLAPLIFTSLLLALTVLPKKLAIPIFTLTTISHISFFISRYKDYFYPSDDPSILKNEISAIDWVYQRSGGEGFYVYNYLPSIFDYPYQYLFWWHGLKAYGYLPCEYSSFPSSPKLFIKHPQDYSQPTRNCRNLRFLIIEPDKSEPRRQAWMEAARKNTQLIEETNIGNIKVEKRTF